MRRFGELLRFYRQRCLDPDRAGRPLTQERLGELIGVELGDAGYTGAAVSEWERGKSQIHKDQRTVLTALIKALVACGGLQTISEADTLLHTGNYRSLDETELAQIFPEGENDMAETVRPSHTEGQWRLIVMFLGELIFRPSENMRQLLSDSSQAPPPHWPHFLLRALGWPWERWSSEEILRAVSWVVTWLLTWQLTFPLLKWPFANPWQARSAAVLYISGALLLPLFIGVLTRTKDDEFWRRQNLATARPLRLYTHQGALIGFHLGYMMVVAITLIGYYLGIEGIGLPFVGAAAVWPVIVGYAAARQVPFNLWRAFGQLRLGDGGVFFVFVLFGPFWGLFFLNFYPLLLTPSLGVIILLLSLAILAGLMTWQKNRTGASALPTYLWAGIFGALFAAQQAAAGAGVLSIAILIGLIAAIVVLLARDQLYITLTGAIGFLLIVGVLALVFNVDRWLGLLVMVAAGMGWRRWGKTYIWFPMRFWLVVFTAVGAVFLAQRAILPDIWATAVFGAMTLAILLNWKRGLA